MTRRVAALLSSSCELASAPATSAHTSSTRSPMVRTRCRRGATFCRPRISRHYGPVVRGTEEVLVRGHYYAIL